jgi:malonyl-CoA O-methyltransferase
MDRYARRDASDLYAQWAPHYTAEAHNPLMAAEQQAVTDLLPAVAGLTVLDAGCGTGRYARRLMDAGARSVIGIDASPAMLSHAWEGGARYVRGDIRAMPVAAATFDLVVSGLMLPDIADLGGVVREWYRVLRPGGAIVCSTLHPVGAELGWTRTFETPHGTHRLPANWHTLDDHRRACSDAGLVIDAVAEPGLHPDAAARRLPSPRVPVALVLRARRPRLP